MSNYVNMNVLTLFVQKLMKVYIESNIFDYIRMSFTLIIIVTR